MNFENLASLRNYLSVSEHKAGTIKLKVTAAAVSDPAVKNIIAEFKGRSMPKAILDIKFNFFTQAVEIKYDTQSIRPEDIEEFLTTQDPKRFLQLAESYYASLTA
ncbi:MAG: hypothetical protein K2I05_07760 [Mailhella sp.]|nr:hypothetical protein [Mailhella sp.]